MAQKSAPKRKTAARKVARTAKTAKSAAAGRKRPARATKPAAKAKTAKKVGKKAPAKATPRAASKKTVKEAAKPAPRKVVAKKAVVKKVVVKKVVAKAKAVVTRAVPAKAAPRPKAVAKKAAAAPARKTPLLDRERRVIRESDLPPSAPSSLVPNQHASAASSGADEMRIRLANNPSGPELAAGDPDVDWQSAATVGDEAPGGDNQTPDQDVVEDIGRALGVQYDDDEELQGGDEIAARDQDRWELDPASSEDFEDR